MTERRQLGDILLESGRIVPADIERVLAYQRSHGGYFGEGLIALGILSHEEIDWALADQFDLPFIFPNASAVDRDVARLVPADWALAHLAVPIVRAGDTITVVVADPLGGKALDELRSRTGCEVDMALASASRIRELIHAIYASQVQRQFAQDEPLSLSELIGNALAHGAEQFGVSIRGMSATGWWRTRTESRRWPLLDGWKQGIEEAVYPSPFEQLRESESGRVKWKATLNRAGLDLPIEAQAMAGEGGADLLFSLLDPSTGTAPLIADVVLPPRLVTELRLLWRGGAARIGFAAARQPLGRAVLPHLPVLGLGEQTRAAHITTRDDGHGAYTLRAGSEAGFADMVTSYEFDALTLDVTGEDYPVRELMHAAPLTFLLVEPKMDEAAASELGLNWMLSLLGQPGSYAWDLRALHS